MLKWMGVSGDLQTRRNAHVSSTSSSSSSSPPPISADGPTTFKAKQMNPHLVNYISGVCGGVAVVLVGHPFDTTKTRLQTAPEGFYSSSMDCVKKTYQWEGLRGFYSGIMSPMLGQMFFRAASFATFYSSVNYLKSMRIHESSSSSSFSSSSSSSSSSSNTNQQLFASEYMLAGAMTGFCISFIETPIDLVKTKLQTQIFNQKLGGRKADYTNFTGCVKSIYSCYGLKGLWQGWRATAIRNIPANALFFPVNEVVKGKFAVIEGKRVEEISMSSKFVAGACAGLGYWVGTYPLDAIKGKVMGYAFENRKGWLETCSLMYSERGWKAFFTGLLPCAARSIPACAAMFATFDCVKNFLSLEQRKN